MNQIKRTVEYLSIPEGSRTARISEDYNNGQIIYVHMTDEDIEFLYNRMITSKNQNAHEGTPVGGIKL